MTDNAHLKVEIAPGVTVEDLINAFHDVLDGTQDHDLDLATPADTDRAIRVRHATEKFWEVNN